MGTNHGGAFLDTKLFGSSTLKITTPPGMRNHQNILNPLSSGVF